MSYRLWNQLQNRELETEIEGGTNVSYAIMRLPLKIECTIEN